VIEARKEKPKKKKRKKNNKETEEEKESKFIGREYPIFARPLWNVEDVTTLLIQITSGSPHLQETGCLLPSANTLWVCFS